MSVEAAVEALAAPVSEAETTSVAAEEEPTTIPGSRLVALPEELLSNIAARLGSDDVFSLRLTCRAIDAKTFHEFATEYFAAKCFIFTTESLKVLGHIASHHKLRDYLTKVYFAPAQIDTPKTHCEHGQPIRLSVRQQEALADYITDQKRLQATGEDKRLIIDAFTKLTSIRVLGFIDTLAALPDGAECRGIQKVHRTTGSQTPLTGTNHGSGHPNYPWLSHVWNTVLHGLADSGISTVTRLETDLASGLSPLVDLKFKKAAMPQLQHALQNVEDLSLQIRTQRFRLNKLDGEEDAHRARQALKTLALAVPKVTGLKLCFDTDSAFLAGGFLKAFMSKVDVAMLAKLSVNSLSIDVKTLAGMVCKLKSVHTLSFHMMDIANGGGWPPILKAIAQLPKLRHLHLMYLTEANHRVYFLEQLNLDEDEWAVSADILAQAAGGGNVDQWTEDDASESDEAPPSLIPDGIVADVPALAEPPIAKSPCRKDGGEEYKAPGCQLHPERGYYVCLQGQEQIQREIPRFIQEYNTGESTNGDDINDALFNTILGGGAGGFPGIPAALMGMPVPPPGGAANAHVGGNPTGNTQPNTNAGGIPAATLQAMFGPPMQTGGNAQNGFATFALPVPVGGFANHFANPFAGAAMPPQQGPPQAPQTQPAPQPQHTPQSQTQQLAANPSNDPLAVTTEGAANDSVTVDDLD